MLKRFITTHYGFRELSLFEQYKEENLRTEDIISVRQVNTALENLKPILTNKGADFVLINNSVSGIVIFGTLVNL